MGRIARLGTGIARLDQRTAAAPPKTADPFYLSAEWNAARAKALQRAGFRCEQVVEGVRCPRGRKTRDRLIVDHIVERRDGGADLDQNNLQCLCFSHHGMKTAVARSTRMASRP